MICNIIDIYDACRSERCYKNSLSYETTLTILNKEYKKYNWNKFIYNIILKDTLPKFEAALLTS